MSTRAMVGFEKEDGTIIASYCHYAGDIADALMFYWNSDEDAERLASYGYMSEVEGYFIDVTAGADPSDEFRDASIHKNIDDLMEYGSICDFFYVWDGVDWMQYSHVISYGCYLGGDPDGE